MNKPAVFIGTDCGATTTKTGGVWADGSMISTTLLQRSTRSEGGPAEVIKGWVEGVGEFLAANQLEWSQVRGMGVAVPGVFQSYGVLECAPNMPTAFHGWKVKEQYEAALAAAAGHAIPVAVGNDGNYGGVAEAQRVRGDRKASVVMLAPGSGLGCAYVDANGLPLDGDTLAGMEAAHMPAPLHLLGAKPYPCGCGRTWGCVEVYTTISGLPYLLEEALVKYPTHELATANIPVKEKVLSLRGRAQKRDPLAVGIFDFQARALGLHIASLVLALDPEFVVIGGGLMDEGATTPEFREKYLRTLRETADPYLWPAQRQRLKIVPASLGDLSQAIGGALVALYTSRQVAS